MSGLGIVIVTLVIVALAAGVILMARGGSSRRPDQRGSTADSGFYGPGAAIAASDARVRDGGDLNRDGGGPADSTPYADPGGGNDSGSDSSSGGGFFSADSGGGDGGGDGGE